MQQDRSTSRRRAGALGSADRAGAGAARAGFTVVELCLGLAVTALVMTSLAAFATAMSSAWRQSAQGQSQALLAAQARARVQSELRQARLIGATRAGSMDESAAGAAVIYWRDDAATADGYIEGAEVALIEHDRVNHVLRLYPSGQGDPTTKWQWTVFTSPDVIDQFKVGRTSKVLARDVYGMTVQATGTTGTNQSPSVQFAIKIRARARNVAPAAEGDAAELTQYGTVTVRAPASQPAY